MAFNCPACCNVIRHSETERMPRPGVIYRCPICRLELIVDAGGTKMTLAPLPITSTENSREAKRKSGPASRAEAADYGQYDPGPTPAQRRHRARSKRGRAASYDPA